LCGNNKICLCQTLKVEGKGTSALPVIEKELDFTETNTDIVASLLNANGFTFYFQGLAPVVLLSRSGTIFAFKIITAGKNYN